jgi:hypothetical protein
LNVGLVHFYNKLLTHLTQYREMAPAFFGRHVASFQINQAINPAGNFKINPLRHREKPKKLRDSVSPWFKWDCSI